MYCSRHCLLPRGKGMGLSVDYYLVLITKFQVGWTKVTLWGKTETIG